MSKAQIGHRRGHSLATVYSEQTLRNQTGKKAWISKSKAKDFKEGFYMFGGQGQDDAELFNDLWLIRPNQLRNKGSIDIENLRYKSQDPELTLTIECISEFS